MVLSVEVEMWGCRNLPLGDSRSSVWLPKRDHLCGNHLLVKLGAAEVVKGTPVFPFSVSQFHLLEGLSVVQAEPSPAGREVQDHGRHFQPWEGVQKKVSPNVCGIYKVVRLRN